MRASHKLRGNVVDTSQALHARGWVANHDGNITLRLADNRFLATPTATSKASVTERDLIEVDREGKRVAGNARPFGELSMHLAIYAGRDDIGAVVHAHPPYATALACSGSPVIERPFIAEAVVSLGPRIPTIGFAAPGASATDALAAHVLDVDAVLIANHGVFAWGANLEQAYLRLELVEHLARIATLAQTTGGVRLLPEAAMAPLLASRARAGLGKAADRATQLAGQPGPADACAPAPHAPNEQAKSAGHPNLAAIIREELAKALDG